MNFFFQYKKKNLISTNNYQHPNIKFLISRIDFSNVGNLGIFQYQFFLHILYRKLFCNNIHMTPYALALLPMSVNIFSSACLRYQWHCRDKPFTTFFYIFFLYSSCQCWGRAIPWGELRGGGGCRRCGRAACEPWWCRYVYLLQK